MTTIKYLRPLADILSENGNPKMTPDGKYRIGPVIMPKMIPFFDGKSEVKILRQNRFRFSVRFPDGASWFVEASWLSDKPVMASPKTVEVGKKYVLKSIEDIKKERPGYRSCGRDCVDHISDIDADLTVNDDMYGFFDGKSEVKIIDRGPAGRYRARFPDDESWFVDPKWLLDPSAPAVETPKVQAEDGVITCPAHMTRGEELESFLFVQNGLDAAVVYFPKTGKYAVLISNDFLGDYDGDDYVSGEEVDEDWGSSKAYASHLAFTPAGCGGTGFHLSRIKLVEKPYVKKVLSELADIDAKYKMAEESEEAPAVSGVTYKDPSIIKLPKSIKTHAEAEKFLGDTPAAILVGTGNGSPCLVFSKKFLEKAEKFERAVASIDNDEELDTSWGHPATSLFGGSASGFDNFMGWFLHFQDPKEVLSEVKGIVAMVLKGEKAEEKGAGIPTKLVMGKKYVLRPLADILKENGNPKKDRDGDYLIGPHLVSNMAPFFDGKSVVGPVTSIDVEDDEADVAFPDGEEWWVHRTWLHELPGDSTPEPQEEAIEDIRVYVVPKEVTRGEELESKLFVHGGKKAAVVRFTTGQYAVLIPNELLSKAEELDVEDEVAGEDIGEDWGSSSVNARSIGFTPAGCGGTGFHLSRARFIEEDEVKETLDSLESLVAKVDPELREMPTFPADTDKGKVLNHLLSGKSITPLEALGVYRIYRLAAVIHRLRQAGYDIRTDIEKDATRKAYARYSLA